MSHAAVRPDVVVARARAAGAATAMSLAKAGPDVVVAGWSRGSAGVLGGHPLVRSGLGRLRTRRR
jgi:predicted NAD/FAD-dependent oxidoreductase